MLEHIKTEYKSKQSEQFKGKSSTDFQQVEYVPNPNSQFTSNAKQRIEFESGIVYQGQVKDGKRQGYGIQKWPDGAVYVGFWKNNKSNGKGKFTHPDGDYYDGQWK